MMEAARSFETFVNFYQTTRRYNPEDSHRLTNRRENLKSYIFIHNPLLVVLHALVWAENTLWAGHVCLLAWVNSIVGTHCWAALGSNNSLWCATVDLGWQSKSDLRSLLEEIVTQQWFWHTFVQEWPWIILVQEWLRTQQWSGLHQCNNDLCDVAWRTPLKCWCTPKSTPFQSCFVLVQNLVSHARREWFTVWKNRVLRIYKRNEVTVKIMKRASQLVLFHRLLLRAGRQCKRVWENNMFYLENLMKR
jgi:hypothetical protein